MYILRRLKKLGCKRQELVDVLRQQILSVVEYASPFWSPRITKVESIMIERILKMGLQIILQEEYKSFRQALETVGMKTLSQHRKDILYKFSKGAEKSGKFNKWFSENEPEKRPRLCKNTKKRFKSVSCRTTRFKRSSLPVITEALEWHPPLRYFGSEIY